MISIPRGFILLPVDCDDLYEVSNAPLIKFSSGKAKAVTFEELIQKSYYGGVRQALRQKLHRDIVEGDEYLVPLDFNTVLEQRIEWALSNKEINKGKFDDRKLRFSGYDKRDNNICLYLGPSHFEEHAATNIKSISDLSFREELLKKGVRDYGDQFAYFADNLALNCVVLTSEQDGSERVLIGKRSAQQRSYPGFWHNIGGFADSKDIFPLLQANDSDGIRSALGAAMKKELLEEAAIADNDLVSIKEIGVSYGWNSFDINYIAKITSPADYVCTKGHFKSKDKEEHSGFISTTFEDHVAVLAGDSIFDSKDGVIKRPADAAPSDVVPIGLGGLLIYIGQRDEESLHRILSSPQYRGLRK
ncbi:MAG: hypothetical protein AABX52_03435 [Nanoarchaeota archaeon]